MSNQDRAEGFSEQDVARLLTLGESLPADRKWDDYRGALARAIRLMRPADFAEATPQAPGADTLGGRGEEPVASLRQIIWAMRNWAGVAETCAVTEGHAPSCIRIWADMLEQLPAESSGGDAVDARLPDGWIVKRSGVEAFVAGPNGGGWFQRKGSLWQRTLFDLAEAIASGAEHGLDGELK